MSEEREKKKEKVSIQMPIDAKDAEELQGVLSVVSKEIPSLIRGIIGSVFSEEAGRDMGKAAAAFYKQLKDAGMPEETAVKMTENYISVFTNLGEVMKRAVSGGERQRHEHAGDELGDELSKEVQKKIREKLAERSREEE